MSASEVEVALHPALPELPPRIKRLPVDSRGFPVPWFVQWFNEDGSASETYGGVRGTYPDFRVVDSRKRLMAIKHKLCWVCGAPLGRWLVFIIGPMCAINRVSGEPPSHRECAEFTARACPFLSKPKVGRRDGLPAGTIEAAGVGLKRNPGVTLLWVTKSYSMFKVDKRTEGKVTAEAGWLVQIGEPEETLWFAEGRVATRDECLASIHSGLPLLMEAAAVDGPNAIGEIERRYSDAMKLVPHE